MSIRISSLRETVGRRRSGGTGTSPSARTIERNARRRSSLPRELVRTERNDRRCGKAEGSALAEAGKRLAVGLECAVAEPFQRGGGLAAFLLPEFRLLAFLLDAAVVLDLGVLVALGIHRDGRLAVEEAAEQRVELGDAVVRRGEASQAPPGGCPPSSAGRAASRLA